MKVLPKVLDPDSGESVYGYTDPDTHTVYLEKSAHRKMLQILLHEMVHVAVYSSGYWRTLQYAIKDDGVRSYAEELLADAVFPAFLACLENMRHTPKHG